MSYALVVQNIARITMARATATNRYPVLPVCRVTSLALLFVIKHWSTGLYRDVMLGFLALSTPCRQRTNKVKDKDKPEDGQGAVYKIKCCECQATHIGETGRNLSTRLTEHKRAARNDDINNHIAEHHLQTKHQIDWDSATRFTCSTINDSL